MNDQRRPRSRSIGGLVLGAVIPMLSSEIAYWRTARSAGPVPTDGRVAIVVLGLPGTNVAFRAAQRWRVGLAMRAWRETSCERVVFTGGPVRSKVSESSEMAAMAMAMGLPSEVTRLEEHSRSTWENVELAAPMLADVDCVIIASDVLHAARARSYWRAQFGDRSPQLVLADRYRPFDHTVLRLASTVGEVVRLVRRPS